MKTQRTNLAGFTLVELLIAVAVSTVLIAATALVVSAGMRTFASASTTGENELRRVMLVSALNQDIASAMPLNGIQFTGEHSTMSFPRMLSMTHSTNSTTIVTVTWEHSPERGMVRTLTLYDGTTTRESFGHFPHLFLSYAGDDDEENALPLRTVVWQDRWTPRRFPGVVRVDVGDFILEVSVACSDFALADEEAPK